MTALKRMRAERLQSDLTPNSAHSLLEEMSGMGGTMETCPDSPLFDHLAPGFPKQLRA